MKTEALNLSHSAISMTLCLSLVCSLANATPDLEAWAGVWKGTCQPDNFNTSQILQPYEMSLTVSPREKHTDWIIQYQGQGPRNYKMVVGKPEISGHFVLDEQNGIVIDRYISGPVMTDLFVVNSLIIQTVSRVEGNSLRMETRLFNGNRFTDSQHTLMGTRVRSYELRDNTLCELTRQPEASANK